MLTEQFAEYVRACFAGIWIETLEPDEALREIAELCERESWTVATWDIERGLNIAGNANGGAATTTTEPVAAIQSASALASEDGAGVLVLQNFHRLLGSLETIRPHRHRVKPCAGGARRVDVGNRTGNHRRGHACGIPHFLD